MTLQSMTGFARADGARGGVRFHWELRSVNGRGLDIRLRLPPGYDGLEAAVREAISKRLARGNVTATLVVDQAAEAGAIRINEQALAVVLAAVDRLVQSGTFERPRPEGVLGLRGVIEVGSGPADDSEGQAFAKETSTVLTVAIEGLVAARKLEGARLSVILNDAIDRIDNLVQAIAASPARRPEAVALRLGELVTRIVETGVQLDKDRLHQEAILVATRADVEEEIKRLGSHITAARELLASSAPAGRRLDFLSQELNREANTICSKSNDTEMTRLGLELKAVIDQVREQVQNIE
ncbi:MAG: YicC/YloC family endoribonuclease [Hyphomicrobiaceae bacterium]|nr:YicC/YloC family endoribonuclease [Hyphomicrobiaceae bacterium]